MAKSLANEGEREESVVGPEPKKILLSARKKEEALNNSGARET